MLYVLEGFIELHRSDCALHVVQEEVGIAIDGDRR